MKLTSKKRMIRRYLEQEYNSVKEAEKSMGYSLLELINLATFCNVEYGITNLNENFEDNLGSISEEVLDNVTIHSNK